MEDRKFEILKNRLDALDYKHPFTQESIPLIEAMLSDLSTLHQSLNKLRQSKDTTTVQSLNKRIEYLNREKQRLEEEIQKEPKNNQNEYDKEALLRVINDLRSENKILNSKLAAWHVPQYSEFDPRSTEYIEKLFQDCNSLRKSLEESENTSQRLVLENQNLIDRLRIMETQNQNLKKEISISSHTVKEITSENKSTTEEFFSLKQAISSYESKHIMHENEINRLRLELQKSQQQSRNLENSLSSYNKENIKLRSEIESFASAKIRSGSTLDSLQRQLEILTNENNKLHSLREEERKTVNELENKNNQLELELSQSFDKLRLMVKENQNFSESLRDRMEEVKIKDSQQRTVEKEMEAYKVYVKKYEESLVELKKVKELNENFCLELRKTSQELNETKGQLRYKEEDAFQCRSYLEQANKDIEQFKRLAHEESLKSESLNTLKRNIDFLEDQLRQVKSQFEESLSRERQLHKEVDQTRLSLQKTEEKLSFALKQADFSSTQKQSIESENTKIQRNLSDALQRENSKNLEIAKMETRIQGLYCEIEDLRIALRKSQDENCVLAQELKDCEKMFEGEKVYVMRLNEQVSQLKDFISTLENARNEAVAKIEHLQIADLDKDNLIKRIREEAGQNKKQLLMSEKVCADGVQAQESLLKQVENVKFELGRKSDELSTLKNSLKNYMNEVEDLKGRIKVLHESEDVMKRSIRELEIEKSRFEEQARVLGAQNDENQRTLFKTQGQFSDLNQTFNSLSRDNKRYEEKIRALDQENQNLLTKLEDQLKDIRTKQEIISNISKENEELCIKFKGAQENLEKMSRSYDYLNLDFKKLSSKVLSSENQNENLKKQEEIWLRNRNDMEEEIRRVIRNAEISDFKRMEAEKAFEELKRETQQQRLIVRDMDYSNDDLHRRLTTIENEKSFYENRLKAAESEILSLKTQLELEKQKSEDLEMRNFRKNEFSHEHKMQVQNSNELITELYKQIEAYKCDSLKLEMDYMKLMDDYTKTKRQLQYAEARISELEQGRR